MTAAPNDTVGFRIWPPVAIGAPWVVGWLATQAAGDPLELGGWRMPVGAALFLFFVVWNGWSLWLFGRHETGLLPGQATIAIIDTGPYRFSRNPLYVGLLALYVARSGSFGTAYGPLTGIFALLLWANLSSVALFLGIAFAAQLEAVRAGASAPSSADPLTVAAPSE